MSWLMLYIESTHGLIKGDADIILIETIFDTLNAKLLSLPLSKPLETMVLWTSNHDFWHHY